MPLLFGKEQLQRYLEHMRDRRPQEAEIVRAVRPWVNLLQGRSSGLTEQNLEQEFNQTFWIKLLGYVGPPKEQFSFVAKKQAKENQGFPDILFGHFTLDNEKRVLGPRIVVGEQKGPNTDLDKIDPSRGKSPVEQAFEYGRTNGRDVRWIIVTNMRVIRLYHITSAKDLCQEFLIEKFLDGNNLTEAFWEFYFLLHSEYLIPSELESPVAALLSTTLRDRIALTDAFYKYYRQILVDTYKSLEAARPDLAATNEGQQRLAEAAHKLLHRGIMICFMSDHPLRLLPHGLLDDVISNALRSPVLGPRVYPALKGVFAAVNVGSSQTFPYRIFGYDGGLFAADGILDDPNLYLPDSLFTQPYAINNKQVSGIFGFRQINFYDELSPHLLGRLFEHSVADQEQIARTIQKGARVSDSINLQRELGIVYTREALSEFAARSVLGAVFSELRSQTLAEVGGRESPQTLKPQQESEFWTKYLNRLLALRIADIACGSGAFLVECYKTLSEEARSAFEMQKHFKPANTLDRFLPIDAELLRSCFFGKDILAGAVSVAELALWLVSVHKDSPLINLQKNFSVGDSLTSPGVFLPLSSHDHAGFDIVIGNPPWGGTVSDEAKACMRALLPAGMDINQVDSFELFILLALKSIKPQGRLCFVLPHTLLYPQKELMRRFLLDNFKIERWHYLGSDWFGADIRYSTTLVQLKKQAPIRGSTFKSMILVDEDRRSAIRGEVDLGQLEESYAYDIPQERCRRHPTADVEPFRYLTDDPILEKMDSASRKILEVCEWGRGVEMSKSGQIQQCPGCGKWDVPPREDAATPELERKKKCNHCGHEYKVSQALARVSIVAAENSRNTSPFIDGDSFQGRYKPLNYRGIHLGYDGINYKEQGLYASPKLLIRQAGVGIAVAYDDKQALCPQSVYVYRVAGRKEALSAEDTPTRKAWSDVVDERFLLAVLQSRVFAYYIFKRFSEVDASQAFAKLTHTRLWELPIPVRHWQDKNWKKAHDQIVQLVDRMLAGDPIGGPTDWDIESKVAELYGLTASDRAHISSQLGLVAYHGAMKQLFPEGPPPPPPERRMLQLTP